MKGNGSGLFQDINLTVVQRDWRNLRITSVNISGFWP